MRDLLRSGVGVSANEVKENYLRKSDRVNLEYLRFPIHRYENEVELRPDEIAGLCQGQRRQVQEALPRERRRSTTRAAQAAQLRFLLSPSQ